MILVNYFIVGASGRDIINSPCPIAATRFVLRGVYPVALDRSRDSIGEQPFINFHRGYRLKSRERNSISKLPSYVCSKAIKEIPAANLGKFFRTCFTPRRSKDKANRFNRRQLNFISREHSPSQSTPLFKDRVITK